MPIVSQTDLWLVLESVSAHLIEQLQFNKSFFKIDDFPHEHTRGKHVSTVELIEMKEK